MKKKVSILITVIITFLITFTVLSFYLKNKKSYDENNTEFKFNLTFSDNYAFRVVDNRLYFWDTLNNTYNIFCSQPNCKHQTLEENLKSTCTAVPAVPEYNYYYAFICHDRLYSIYSLKVNEFLIYESDIDGSNKKLFYTADVSMNNLCYPLFRQNKLFFLAEKYDIQKALNNDFSCNYSLCMIDFSDRSFKEIKKFDNLNQLYIFPNIYLNDNLLYYQYAYYDDLSINENEHDSDVQENSYIFFESVNIDSKKVRKIFNFVNEDFYAWECQDKNVIYNIYNEKKNRSKVYLMNLASEKSELLFEEENDINYIFKLDNLILYEASDSNHRNICVYDMKSKDKKVHKLELDEYLYFYGKSGDNMLMQFQKGDKNKMGSIPIKDLFELNFNNITYVADQ